MNFAKKTISLVLVCSFLSVYSVLFASAADFDETTWKKTGNNREDLIGIAMTQLSYKENEKGETKYGTYYGVPDTPWCLAFIAWCARKAGVSTNVIPDILSCTRMKNYFIEKYGDSVYHSDADYTPQRGDIMLISYSYDENDLDHMGLVLYTDNGRVTTIEGNRRNGEGTDYAVRRCSYSLDKKYIVAYLTPKYEGTNITVANPVGTKDDEPIDPFVEWDENGMFCYTAGDRKKTYMKYGDADSDGEVSVNDARFILRKAVRLEEFSALQSAACDIDHGGDVDVTDARFAIRIAVKLDDAETLFQQYY